MVAVNVLYNLTTGRILSANLNAISPTPVGHAIAVKDLASLTDLFGKLINPGTLQVEGKNYLKIDSPVTLPTGTVDAALFSKHNGVTNDLMDDPGDNEPVVISARQPDFSFNAAFRRAFFDILQTSLVAGIGQVKLATGLAPGAEVIVVFNDTLMPVFQKYDYT